MKFAVQKRQKYIYRVLLPFEFYSTLLTIMLEWNIAVFARQIRFSLIMGHI